MQNVIEGEGVVLADPLFTDDPVPYSQGEDSPCIDAGDPEAACDNEPADDADECRLDMGYLGNTPAAPTR